MEREQNDLKPDIDTLMDMIWLIRCVLSGTKPDTIHVAGMNQKKLFELASRHSLTALVGTALHGVDTGEMEKRWQNAVDKAVRRTVLFDAERRELLSFMEENGIW